MKKETLNGKIIGLILLVALILLGILSSGCRKDETAKGTTYIKTWSQEYYDEYGYYNDVKDFVHLPQLRYVIINTHIPDTIYYVNGLKIEIKSEFAYLDDNGKLRPLVKREYYDNQVNVFYVVENRSHYDIDYYEILIKITYDDNTTSEMIINATGVPKRDNYYEDSQYINVDKKDGERVSDISVVDYVFYR